MDSIAQHSETVMDPAEEEDAATGSVGAAPDADPAEAAAVSDDDAGIVADGEPELLRIELVPDTYGVLGTVGCPLCSGAGSVPYAIRQSPRLACCDECAGTGFVYTGSLVGEYAMLPCERCTGNGYVAVVPPTPDYLAATLVTESPPAPGMVKLSDGRWGYPPYTG